MQQTLNEIYTRRICILILELKVWIITLHKLFSCPFTPSSQEARKKKKKKRTHTSDAVVRSFINEIKEHVNKQVWKELPILAYIARTYLKNCIPTVQDCPWMALTSIGSSLTNKLHNYCVWYLWSIFCPYWANQLVSIVVKLTFNFDTILPLILIVSIKNTYKLNWTEINSIENAFSFVSLRPSSQEVLLLKPHHNQRKIFFKQTCTKRVRF